MNILLWVFQDLLALHTAIGAVWKFSHSAEQTMPSLKAIPAGVWQAMSVLELFFALGLILPALIKSLGITVPIAAICIALEMIAFMAIHLYSGDTNYGPLFYWLIVTLFCAFIAYGRTMLRPF
jgi:hypothetical protein